MNRLRQLVEDYLVHIVVSAFIAGVGLATWILCYWYVPSQLIALQNEVAAVKQAAAQQPIVSLATPGPSPPLTSTAAGSPSPMTSETPKSSQGVTLEQLEEQYAKLKGRFGDQEALIEQYEGTAVAWKVAVHRVSSVAGLKTIHLSFKPTNPNLDYHLCTFARFPDSKRDRLFQLRQGDTVVIEGVLKASVTKNEYVIEGTDFRLVP